MDLVFVIAAFVLGFLASLVRLPPLVGYLAAGFVLHGLGYSSSETIETIADMGVLLLLFGIGLKLRLRTLAKPAVWGGASVHLIAATAVIGGLFLGMGALGLPVVSALSGSEALLIGFALSFSSTVFAVQALEQRDESSSLAGRLAIAILLIQDVFAVGFIALSSAETPSIWAIPVVIAVVAARPLYGWILDRTGHGELMVLLGFVLAIGVGAGSFEFVGLKPDIGALLMGVTLAGHRRAAELSDRLLGFKDILLIGFFLSIGLGGLPDGSAIAVAVVALALVPLKAAGFLLILPRFRLRTRTAWHASVTLATFSEFGLIVVAAGTNEGYLDDSWTAIVALVVAASFVLAAPLSSNRYALFQRFSDRLEPLERSPLLDEDSLIDPGDARILVFGMGRVGAGAFDELVKREGDVVVGVDRSEETVALNERTGREVIRGDALDTEFWTRIRLDPNIELVVVAMGDHQANLEAVRRVKANLPGAKIAAAATYADEVAELRDAGVDVARNLFSEAGQGLADDACDLILD